jgi:hypothetical protein
VTLTVHDAITVQLARDAGDERKAWVQFAAGEYSTGARADALLDEYRARFAVEFTDGTEESK